MVRLGVAILGLDSQLFQPSARHHHVREETPPWAIHTLTVAQPSTNHLAIHWRMQIAWECAIGCEHHLRQPDFSLVLGGVADSPPAVVGRVRFINPVRKLPSKFTLVPIVLRARYRRSLCVGNLESLVAGVAPSWLCSTGSWPLRARKGKKRG
jgi:hypothetical protein